MEYSFLLKSLHKKPKVFEHLTDKYDYIWFEMANPQGAVAYVAAQISQQSAGIHCEVVKWNHHSRKIIADDWKMLKAYLKTIGIRELFVLKEITPTNQKTTDKLIKFIKLYGFPEPNKYYLSKLEI